MGKHSRRAPGDAPRDERPAADEPASPGLRRDADGRVVLDEVAPAAPVHSDDDSFVETTVVDEPIDVGEDGASRRRHPARRALDAARRGRRTTDEVDEVGGPIQPTPTVYFGRPPGTENRRAGGAALVGGLLLVASAFVPWATRAPESLGATSFGWRDASGAFGPGPWMLLLGLVALCLAAGALMGSPARILQVGDVVLGAIAIVVAIVEYLRVRDADGIVSDLTEGRASVSPGWGIALAVLGGVALLVAAVVHRATPPAWRQQ